MIHLDTNVLAALLYGEETTDAIVRTLDGLRDAPLHIYIGVYVELLSAPGMQQARLDAFLERYEIEIGTETTREDWLLAGAAFRAYAQRRRQSGGGQPRRLLMDFLIGAHAARHAQTLLTMDPQHYRQSFPELNAIDPATP